MQIAFWGNYHGQAGITSNTIATAITIAMNYNLNVLLTHTQYSMSNMETAFLSENETDITNGDISNFDDVGIDAIERLSKTGKISSSEFSSYTKTLIDNRLDLLTGSTKSQEDLFKDMSNSIINVLDYANKAYDLVLIDVNSGVQNPITNKVLEQSDIIVINLSQNEKVISDYFNKRELNKTLEGKKTIIVLGRYDFNSKCSCKYVKSVYKNKEDIYCVPYSSEFMDSNNNHSVLKFFLTNQNIKETNVNYVFFKEIEKLSTKIIENLNLDSESLQKPLQQQGILRQVKSILNI